MRVCLAEFQLTQKALLVWVEKFLKGGEQIFKTIITAQFVITHTAMLEEEPHRESDDWTC